MACSPRVAILFHEYDRDPRGSQIFEIAQCWRRSGLTVEFVYGTHDWVPADLALLHVNLSVIPEEYLQFARRYPRVLNGAVHDIRKSRISKHLLRADDDWPGAVIVKTDLNYAGVAERQCQQGGQSTWRHYVDRVHHRMARKLNLKPLIFGPRDYRVYPNLRAVPRSVYTDPKLIVEAFLPEREGELYCLRHYHFLGDQSTCVRITSPNPIVNSTSRVSRDVVPVHPQIVAKRHELGFDYGKFDYVMHQGEPILLDVNRTPGGGGVAKTTRGLRQRATGINAFLPG